MTQYHEGQEVEVWRPVSDCSDHRIWRKAKIACQARQMFQQGAQWGWQVEFPDGTRAMFDAEHIRAVECSLYDQRNDGPVFSQSYDQQDAATLLNYYDQDQ